MSAEAENRRWQRARNFGRALIDLFFMPAVPDRWLWRWIFLRDGQMRRAGELALARLKRFCFADRSIFGGDAGTNDSMFLLGVREGRRQVWLHITKHLNLDDDAVQKLVENDDGY